MILVFAKVEFLDLASLGRKIDGFEIDPEGIGRQRRFEEVEFALVIDDSTPTGRGDIRLLWSIQTIGDRDVADDAEDAGERPVCVLLLGNGIDIEARANRSAARLVPGSITVPPIFFQ